MRGSRQRGGSIKVQSHSQGPGWLERMERRGHGQRGPEPAHLGFSSPRSTAQQTGAPHRGAAEGNSGGTQCVLPHGMPGEIWGSAGGMKGSQHLWGVQRQGVMGWEGAQ